jgi:molecular chaperone GrpE
MTDEKETRANTSEEKPEETQHPDFQGEAQTTWAQRLAEKDGEIASCIDRLQRLQAEFENYKKRILREMTSVEERAIDQTILDFLPLFDNLERAFASFTGNNDAQSFIDGVERIFAQFDQILKQKTVTPIEAIGSYFDPAKHEALLSVPSNKEKDLVLEEFERGYIRNGRVLRPSKVKVSQGKPEPKEEIK